MKNFKSQKGFTLIELLVAMSLFIVFISIASGGFVRALRTQRAIVALMAVNDNVSLTLEQISREMRTGYNFCTKDQPVISVSSEAFPDCASLDKNELMFVNASNDVVFYKWDGKAVLKGTSDVFLNKTYEKITGDNVKVRNFNIKLMGNEKGDDYPPRITISISVSPDSDISYLNDIYTNVQSTISSRSLDT
jgi:prepilin-type N-terminal cleavage/methylation domain-containing protein